MNFTLTKDGNYAMVFTKEEFHNIKVIISEDNNPKLYEPQLFEPEVEKKQNPFKGLRPRTIAFVEELIKVYGAKGIIPIDDKFQTIRFKHRIENYHSTVLRFEASGQMIVSRNNNETRKRILLITLNF